MFKPLPMRRVTLHLLSAELPEAVLLLAQAGVFNPDSGQFLAEHFPDTPGLRYRELYARARARFDKLRAYLGDVAAPATPQAVRVVPEQELAAADDWLREAWGQCSRCLEAVRHVEEARKRHRQLMQSLDIFAHLDMDLGLLKEQRRFLEVEAGAVPAENLARLKQAVSLAGYALSEFLRAGGSAYAVVAGPRGGEDIRPVLQAAGWHALQLPPEFRKRPREVRDELTAQLARVEADYAPRCELPAEVRRDMRARLAEVSRLLVLAAPFAELAGDALRGRGGLAVLSGWVPAREVAALEAALQAKLAGRFVLAAREPLAEELAQVPSALRHPRWLQPFSTLANLYGVPRYGEFDPTLLFALTYLLMFGMMFGDIGQGALICLAGFWQRRRLRQFAWFAMLAGLSSALFGWLYGSLFGFEGVVAPAWQAPLSDPLLMLEVALGWGVGFILLATLLTIYNRLNEGQTAAALFDTKGLAGLGFYLGALALAYRMAQGRAADWPAWLALLVPLATIFAYKWKETRASAGERVLVAAMEVFEGALGYLANTLSFLRMAAFNLNHMALAVAVFTLAAMVGQAGHWLTVVLGNLFVLALEGGIVAIQALRLEYYEGFSRFFRGDGRAFRPLRLTVSGFESRVSR